MNRRVRWCWHAALVAVITTGLISVAVDPAQAATAETSGPGDGASPSWSGDLDYPVTPQPQEAAPADALSPLAQQLIEAQSSTERLGEQLKSVADELTAAMGATAPRREAWEGADAKARALRAKAADITSQAYMNAMAMGPLRGYAGDLQDLSLLAPGLQAQAQGGGAAGAAARPQERDSIGTEVAAAERDEATAKADLDAAVAAESDIAGRQTVLMEQFQRSQNALTVLQTRNAGQFAALDADRDAYENSLSASRGLGLTVNGMRAAPAALSALAFALSKKGLPYQWAAEGPDSYDCSGLVMMAYRAVGVQLPRVAADQFRIGDSVPVSELLPGDLLYYSTDRADPSKIHHVTMYIGNGMVVHAPFTGQKIKESPIWWTEFFGAKRLVPAVPGPATPPVAVTTPPVAPTETALPSAAPSPSASPSPPPSESPSSSPSASPSQSPSESPSASASASPSLSPSESPSPPPSESPSSSPSPSTSQSASPGPTSSPSPAGSGTNGPQSAAAVVVPAALTAVRQTRRSGPGRRTVRNA